MRTLDVMTPGRFIGILTFFLAYHALKADTIGPYEIYLHGKVIATVAEYGRTVVKIKKESISIMDTLYISRANCPGAEHAVNYEQITMDSAANTRVGSFRSRHSYTEPYKIPLQSILGTYAFVGTTNFDILFYRASDHEQITILGSIRIQIE